LLPCARQYRHCARRESHRVRPAQNLREATAALAPHLAAATPVIACAKGIERGTHKFMTEVIAETAPNAVPAILSGPSFADDVARGLPTAVTLAAKDDALASALVQALGSATFRPYHTSDVRGVEIGGAAKNVLAIAAGIVIGKRLGASALAALTTRGFSELVRLGRACGARTETMSLRLGAVRRRRGTNSPKANSQHRC
jgi:glycerol-3-phosphate dehydrogenase (NAD(P)+)